MASLDILCSDPFNLKNKIKKTEHQKIFRGLSKLLKDISSRIDICLKHFMFLTKTLRPPPPFSLTHTHTHSLTHTLLHSYILNVQSLSLKNEWWLCKGKIK